MRFHLPVFLRDLPRMRKEKQDKFVIHVFFHSPEMLTGSLRTGVYCSLILHAHFSYKKSSIGYVIYVT